MRLAALIGALALLASLATAGSAGAAFPGANGLIAFTSLRDGNAEIYAMNPDGTGQTNLTNHPASDGDAAWSPDGRRIAFTSDRDGNLNIYVMAADGSDQRRITNSPEDDLEPAWSPDGTLIAYTSNRVGNQGSDYEILTQRPQLEEPRTHTLNTADDRGPDWSPDGTRILFESLRDGNREIYTLDPSPNVGPLDPQTRLTNNPAADVGATWHPAGDEIDFASRREGQFQIFRMNPDGSGQTGYLTGPTGKQLNSPAFSPDGTSVTFDNDAFGNYEVVLYNRVARAFTRLTQNGVLDGGSSWQPVNRAPVCQTLTQGVAFETATPITLPCSDPDGDPVTLSIASPASRGALSAIDQANRRVTYTPNSGFSGNDSFAFRASDGELTSAPASAALQVSAPGETPQPPTVGPPVTAPAPVLRSASLTRRRFTARRGAQLRIAASGAARIAVNIDRSSTGRRVRGACRLRTRRNASRPRCTRTVRFAALTFTQRQSVTVRLRGRVRSRRLVPGAYVATVVVRGADGRATSPRRLRFRVIR